MTGADRASAVDLTGLWHGRFSYPRFYEPTPFVATLREAAAHLTGMTQEPCTIGAAAGTTLYGAISGSRQHSAVSFIKTYDGSGGWDHAVLYEGVVSGDGTEIEGRWRIGQWSGTFMMIREASGAAVLERECFELA